MEMINVMWCRFEQSLGTFVLLLVEASSETGLFRHLSDYVFGVRNFENTKPMKVICFSKHSKFQLHFKKAAKNYKKVFCFWDNCIWTGIVKLSLLRTGYFSSAANVLTSSPKIFHVNKRDFFQLNWLGSDQWIWKMSCDADLNSSWARLPCCLWKGPLKRDFLDNYLTTFSESVISKIQKLWRSSLFVQTLKISARLQKSNKNSRKSFFSLR